ncbi:MAG: hypothetical protein CMC96_08965 [Flavobacteriales bacterium]|nr:hypothetical protein [Flavobacteriales bacterium]|tara:strand:- start:15914 stop:17107 length:1194 start_codon:yes stop_codon:yes gene_type:complete
MPRVLRIINRFNLGGPTYNAALLTKHLSPDFETLLIGGEAEESEESSEFILDQLGIEGKIIDEMQRDLGFANDRTAYRKIKQIIKDYKPDIIHTHASKAGAIGRAAGIAYGKAKMVHTFHGHVFHSYFGTIKTNFYKNIERTLALKTDKIIAISNRQKIELWKKHRICSADRIAVVPLGFELEKFQQNQEEKRKVFRQKFNLEDDEVAIGIIGRLAPIKNHSLFIDAFHQLQQQTTQKVRAFIIGDGEEAEYLKKYAKDLNIILSNGQENYIKNTQLHFTSWIKNIDEVNAGLDIVALSSNNEGTPVSLIEAQAAGKPIVSTKVGGISNIVKTNKTAFLVPAEDRKQFTDGLLKLTENKQLRDEMGTHGWQFVNKKFHYKRLVDDIRKLYDELLEKK